MGGNKNDPTRTYVFLGCSLTFGAGVEDDETFPFYFQRLNPRSRVLNYGVYGSGPHQTLQSLKNEGWKYADIVGKNVVGVYTYVDDHIARANLKFSYLMWSHLRVPEFYIDSNGLLAGGELLAISNPIKYWTYFFVKNSYVARHYVRKIYRSAEKKKVEFSKDEVHLTAMIFLEMQKEFYKNFL